MEEKVRKRTPDGSLDPAVEEYPGQPFEVPLPGGGVTIGRTAAAGPLDWVPDEANATPQTDHEALVADVHDAALLVTEVFEAAFMDSAVNMTARATDPMFPLQLRTELALVVTDVVLQGVLREEEPSHSSDS